MTPLDDEFSELTDYDIHPRAVRMLPRAFCDRHDVVILGEMPTDPEIPVTVGMRDPDNSTLRLQIADTLQRRIDCKQLNEYEIEEVVAEGFGDGEDEDKLVLRDLSEREHLSTAQEFFEHVVSMAVKAGASDIHIESFREDVDLRLRIDGIRDQITGDMALAAANTGHVVFGTVHTPDAIGTLTRLRGLGPRRRRALGCHARRPEPAPGSASLPRLPRDGRANPGTTHTLRRVARR